VLRPGGRLALFWNGLVLAGVSAILDPSGFTMQFTTLVVTATIAPALPDQR
jgi:hypothetical protein